MADLTTTVTESVVLNGALRGNTNLGADSALILAVVTTGTNYQVRLTPGTSHILSRGSETAIGEVDVTPAFGTMQDITSLQVRPEGATYSPEVSVFVAAV
jgi:hypothetical protein